MADKRITELNPIVAADTEADVDVLAIADVSAAETKKIKVVDVVAAATGTLPPNTINGDTIIDGSITGGKLEENSITSRELAPMYLLSSMRASASAYRWCASSTTTIAYSTATVDAISR